MSQAAYGSTLGAVCEGVRNAASSLNQQFLDKQEIIRLMCISVIAGEHMVIIGPPGTAKSALISNFSKLIEASYFEYLLTRFTEPNEIFGPIDIQAFKAGQYTRRIEGMMPTSEIVFLDEIFKANSAILNSLLHVINERKYQHGSNTVDVPLLSLFAASNEVPGDENLSALFDRFLIRAYSGNLDSFHFQELMRRGINLELARMTKARGGAALTSAQALRAVQVEVQQKIRVPDDFLAKYKSLVFQIRSEGISISDRRSVKLLKLLTASAALDGRNVVNDADLFIMRHVWNNLDQIDLLDQIVSPVVDAYVRAHPDQVKFLGTQANLEDVLAELQLIKEVLSRSSELSDIQLFTQLRNLNEIKTVLSGMPGATAQRMVAEVDHLLNTVFSSSKFGA